MSLSVSIHRTLACRSTPSTSPIPSTLISSALHRRFSFNSSPLTLVTANVFGKPYSLFTSAAPVVAGASSSAFTAVTGTDDIQPSYVLYTCNDQIISVPTKPIEGQKTGTSGLRKKVKVFMDQNYLANWIQALFNSLPEEDYVNGVLVLGGVGRYFNREAAQIIIKISACNGVGKILVGQEGIMSTPAVSAIIRKRQANGGFIMSASHNPSGPDYDWGIKFNYSSGQPAPESITDKIYGNTLAISEIKMAEIPDIDLSQLGTSKFGKFTVEVVDPVSDYLELMENVFDFNLIRGLLSRSDFRFVFDAMHAVTGAYAKPIFVENLGASLDKKAGEKLISVADVVKEHWATYGRNFFSRYDYEECESEGANKMVEYLRDLISKSNAGDKYGSYTLQFADDFIYTDPVDGSVISKQGIRFVFTDGSRIIYRSSGTGSAGATVRVYIEQYEPDAAKHDVDAQIALKPLIDLALSLSNLKEFT